MNLDLLQWPAMLVTVLAAWFVASSRRGRRETGFWLFLTSNVLWAVWGWDSRAFALIAMQFCLAAMNVRGWLKNKAAGQEHSGPKEGAHGASRQSHAEELVSVTRL